MNSQTLLVWRDSAADFHWNAAVQKGNVVDCETVIVLKNRLQVVKLVCLISSSIRSPLLSRSRNYSAGYAMFMFHVLYIHVCFSKSHYPVNLLHISLLLHSMFSSFAHICMVKVNISRVQTSLYIIKSHIFFRLQTPHHYHICTQSEKTVTSTQLNCEWVNLHISKWWQPNILVIQRLLLQFQTVRFLQCYIHQVTVQNRKLENKWGSVQLASFCLSGKQKCFKAVCLSAEAQLNGFDWNLFYHLSNTLTYTRTCTHTNTTTSDFKNKNKSNRKRFESLGTIVVCCRGCRCSASIQAG